MSNQRLHIYLLELRETNWIKVLNVKIGYRHYQIYISMKLKWNLNSLLKFQYQVLIPTEMQQSLMAGNL